MKRLLSLLLVFLVLVGTGLIALRLLLPVWVKSYLVEAGFGQAEFVVDRLSWQEISLNHITLGLHGEQRLQRLDLSFDLLRLWHQRRAEHLAIEDLDLKLTLRDDGSLQLAGTAYPGKPQANSEVILPYFPAQRIEVRGARLHIDTPSGPITLVWEAELTQVENGDWLLKARLLPRLNGGKAQVDLEARLDSAMQFQAVTADQQFPITLNLDATNLDLAEVGAIAGIPGHLAGHGSLHLILSGTLPAVVPGQTSLQAWWEKVVGQGQLALQLEQGALLNTLDKVTAAVAAEVTLAANRVSIVPAGQWSVGGRVAQQVAPVVFRVSNDRVFPLEVSLHPHLGELRATGKIDFILERESWPPISGKASGRVAIRPKEALDFTLDSLNLSPEPWTVQGLTIQTHELEARISGTPSNFAGQLALSLGIEGSMPNGVSVRGGKTSLHGKVALADQRLTLSAVECVALEASELRFPHVRWLNPVKLCASPKERTPLLSFVPAGELQLSFTLPSHRAAMAIDFSDRKMEVAGSMPVITLSARYRNDSNLQQINVRTKGGRLKLSDFDIELSGIEASLDNADSTSAEVQIASVRSVSKPPLFTPFSIDGNVSGDLDGTMIFETRTRGLSRPFSVSVNGKQDFALAIGELAFRMDDISFSPQGTQPGDLLPPLADVIKHAEGTLGMSGNIVWVENAPASAIRLKLDQLGFRGPGIRVKGVSTRIKGLTTALTNRVPSQEIHIRLLDIGIPLRDGLIRFNTRAAPTVDFEEVRFAWEDGTLKTKPFTIPIQDLGSEHAVTLVVDDIALNSILAFIPLEGLEGTGTLSGQLPLRIKGPQISVDNGMLSNNKPGVLRYSPEQAPAFFSNNSQTELLFAALQDFRYDKLTITANGTTGEDLKVTIALHGANPDLYDGHPFKLNFNLSGKLDQIIRRNLSIANFAQRLTEAIVQYLQ